MSNINKIIKHDDSKDEIMSKEKRDFLVEKHKKQVMENIRLYKYLIIDKEMNLKLYKSLRQIEQEVGVSYSSISKKLKMSNYCICVPKKTTEVYYIQNLAE
tara:strand:- start:17738 stop:18040 length:303 start_codon:yes stop_codon:yes gene_type:complete